MTRGSRMSYSHSSRHGWRWRWLEVRRRRSPRLRGGPPCHRDRPSHRRGRRVPRRAGEAHRRASCSCRWGRESSHRSRRSLELGSRAKPSEPPCWGMESCRQRGAVRRPSCSLQSDGEGPAAAVSVSFTVSGKGRGATCAWVGGRGIGRQVCWPNRCR